MRTFAFRRSGASLTPTVPGSTSRLRSPEADKATQLLRKRISVRSLTQQEQDCPPYTPLLLLSPSLYSLSPMLLPSLLCTHQARLSGASEALL